MLGAHGAFESLESLLGMRQDEVAVLFQLDAAWIVERLGGGLEEGDAFPAKLDVELKSPLHAKAGTVAPCCTARELAFVEDEYPGAAAPPCHMPGTGKAKRPRADDQHVSCIIGHHTPAWAVFASAPSGTGRAKGRGVIIAAEGPPCSSARAATACRQVRPPHHPMPARVVRFIAFGARWPATNPSRSSPRVTFSHRQITVSSFGSRQSPAGTRKRLCTAPWKAHNFFRVASTPASRSRKSGRSTSCVSAAAAAPMI